MTGRKGASGREAHRKLGVDLFNGTWKLIEKRRRTKAEDLRMIHMAHASRYHWSLVGKPTNGAVGEWQVSHVYAILGRAEPALYHAERCLEICRANRLDDWQLAFAYEALARASAVAGRRGDLRKHLAAAFRAGMKIKEKEDRDLLIRDLKTIPAVRKTRV